ncbi:hypothetical protein [Oryza sativa Japonica Group]|uniref:Uncharacterized protein n=1 Tax=Oryza sativa subsp. japonica TaxID=39947 RepID=Q5N9N7_ORYSJ|nr:hypothetical protein [Oryza sativa Japonica Group]
MATWGRDDGAGFVLQLAVSGGAYTRRPREELGSWEGRTRHGVGATWRRRKGSGDGCLAEEEGKAPQRRRKLAARLGVGPAWTEERKRRKGRIRPKRRRKKV